MVQIPSILIPLLPLPPDRGFPTILHFRVSIRLPPEPAQTTPTLPQETEPLVPACLLPLHDLLERTGKIVTRTNTTDKREVWLESLNNSLNYLSRILTIGEGLEIGRLSHDGRIKILGAFLKASQVLTAEDIKVLCFTLEACLSWLISPQTSHWSEDQIVGVCEDILKRAGRGKIFHGHCEGAWTHTPDHLLMYILGDNVHLDWTPEETCALVHDLAIDSRPHNSFDFAKLLLSARLETQAYISPKLILTLVRKSNMKNFPLVCNLFNEVYLPLAQACPDDPDFLRGAEELLFFCLDRFSLDRQRILSELFYALKKDPELRLHVLKEKGREEIIHFIKMTSGFSLPLWNCYRRGEVQFLETIARFFRHVAEDNLEALWPSMIHDDTAHALLMAAIPTREAIMVGDIPEYIRERLALGGHTDHVPQAWRDLNGSPALTFSLKEKLWETRHLDKGHLEETMNIYTSLLLQHAEKIDKSKLVSKLYDFLMEPTAERKNIFFRDLIQYRGQIANIDLRDETLYAKLEIFSGLFSDPDNVPGMLRDLTECVFKSDSFSWDSLQLRLKRSGEKILQPYRVFVQIIKTHETNHAPELQGRRIRSILRRFSESEIHQKLLTPSFELLGAPEVITAVKIKIKQALEAMNQEDSLIKDTATLHQEVQRRICGETMEWVDAGKKQFRLTDGGDLSFRIRAVKGLANTHWLSNAGICITSDTYHWNHPDFVPIAIDEILEGVFPFIVEGFVATFKIEVDEKKYLTLPGINPSSSVLSRVDPELFYDELIERLKLLAKEEGCEGLLIPKPATIHSNRGVIQKIIQGKNYLNFPLPHPIKWQTLAPGNADFSFTEAYLVPITSNP